jgi:hypothetical protein
VCVCGGGERKRERLCSCLPVCVCVCVCVRPLAPTRGGKETDELKLSDYSFEKAELQLK